MVKKGDSIETFLQRVRQQLRADFVEMKSQSVDQMMFIKADAIIPHQYTFYDLILTKGKKNAIIMSYYFIPSKT